MENIKFRVWDNVDYMSKPFTLLDVQRRLTQFTHDCTVMRFTGLKDVNGVDIYEGDIVRFDVIKGNLDHDQYERDQVGEVRIAPNGVSFGGWRYGWVCNIEVIGNVHQNPELLEGDK